MRRFKNCFFQKKYQSFLKKNFQRRELGKIGVSKIFWQQIRQQNSTDDGNIQKSQKQNC